MITIQKQIKVGDTLFILWGCTINKVCACFDFVTACMAYRQAALLMKYNRHEQC